VGILILIAQSIQEIYKVASKAKYQL